MFKQESKIINDVEKLKQLTELFKSTDHKIVVTIGSWDLLHIGHLRYLIQAKSYGDILVVGVDTDSAIKLYKGPLRPVVPEKERMEMLTYQSCVDLITKVDDVDNDGSWQYKLIEELRPDVFIAVEDSYPDEQKKYIEKHCGELIVLPRQAENTSTSKMIQNTIKKHLEQMIEFI